MARPLNRGGRIELRLPQDLKRQCKAQAAQEGKTLTAWIEEALRAALRSANRTEGGAYPY
jgi:predicted HicB family RNase H-like nuclease